jgi:hypothetical protein
VAATSAFLVGVGFAAVSGHWTTRDPAFLPTVGGVFEDPGRLGSAHTSTLRCVLIGVKLVVIVMPLLLTAPIRGRMDRMLRAFAGLGVAALAGYGLALTSASLLAAAHIMGRTSFRHGLVWHVDRWHPWFFLGGLLLVLTMLRLLSGRLGTASSTDVARTPLETEECLVAESVAGAGRRRRPHVEGGS